MVRRISSAAISGKPRRSASSSGVTRYASRASVLEPASSSARTTPRLFLEHARCSSGRICVFGSAPERISAPAIAAVHAPSSIDRKSACSSIPPCCSLTTTSESSASTRNPWDLRQARNSASSNEPRRCGRFVVEGKQRKKMQRLSGASSGLEWRRSRKLSTWTRSLSTTRSPRRPMKTLGSPRRA